MKTIKIMKKFQYRCLVVLMLTIVGVGHLSCMKDDPDDNPEWALDASLLIGRWKTTFEKNDYEIVEFKSDKTYIAEGVYDGEYEKGYGMWSLDAQTQILTLIREDGNEDVEITKLTKTELVFAGSVYRRIETEDDYTEDDQESHKRGEVATTFQGQGSASNPYIISKASELRLLSDEVAKGKTFEGCFFKMKADVFINKNILGSDGLLDTKAGNLEEWIPIGNKVGKVFLGEFDGDGHSISGIYINNSDEYQGLFGQASAVIKNLTIKDSYIKGGQNCGAIAGCINTFYYSKPTVTKDGNKNASINNCYNYGTIISTSYRVGGVAGTACKASKCVNYGIVCGDHEVAGVFGLAHYISDCVNYGSVTGLTKKAAGIVAYLSSRNGYAYNCVNFGTITNRGGEASGVIGVDTYAPAYKTGSVSKNLVNYSSINVYSTGDGAGILSELNSTVSMSYYLNSSCRSGYNQKGGYSNDNGCYSMSIDEMKTKSFLSTLNENAKKLGTNYSKWKAGKNGYPTLEFVVE